MTPRSVLQEFKHNWTPDTYTRLTLARDSRGIRIDPNHPDAVRTCFVGNLCKIGDMAQFRYAHPTTAVEKALSETYNLVQRKIRELGLPGTTSRSYMTVEGVNDMDNGYEVLMGIIDELLVEMAKEDLAENRRKQAVTPQTSKQVKMAYEQQNYIMSYSSKG